MKISKRGFTLIELLVVISIIGLLSSVVLASLQTSRTKAANAKKNVMAKEYVKALELYNDANGGYPFRALGTAWDANTVTCLGINNTGSNCFNNSVTEYTSVQYPAINTGLATFLSGPPANTDSVTATDGDWRGIIYKCFGGTGATSLVTEKCTDYFVGWYMKGIDTKCAGGFLVPSGSYICGVPAYSSDISNSVCMYTNNKTAYDAYFGASCS